MGGSSGDVPLALDDSAAAEAVDEEEAAPYVHDPAIVETAVRLIDQAYDAAPRWWGDVTEQLRSAAGDLGLEPQTPLVRELIFAAAYVLRLIGPGRQRAATAAAAYLEGAESRQDTDLDVTMFLVRAWELARRVGDWALAAGVCEKLVERAGAELSGKAPRAGIALSMLAAAAAKPTRKQAREAPESAQYQGSVGRLLEPAFTAFQGGFQVSYVAEIMRGRASDAAELERINRREVEAYLAQAASSTGLARQSHLRDAARMARNRGFTDLMRQATAELQAIPVKDLGLKEFTWSVRLPSDRVERFLSGFVASTDWRDGLRFFLKTDCPTGDLAELRQEVRDAAKLTPFLSVTGRTLLSREGFPGS